MVEYPSREHCGPDHPSCQETGRTPWDLGPGMAQHQLFTVAAGAQVYVCDPESPWQRGGNENCVSRPM